MAQIRPLNIPKKELKVLIVDDHTLVRHGLKKMLLSLSTPFAIKTAEAGSGEEAIRKINRKDFDLVFMDYQLPGNTGLDTIYRLLRFKSNLKILVLSNYDELTFVESVRDAGARGYLLKNIESAELLKAIYAVLEGKTYYSTDILIKLLEDHERNSYQRNANKKLLTKREIEVLQLIAEELSNDEIAEKLFISKRTVDTHRRNIMIKLKAKNAAGLIKRALKMKLTQ